MKLNQEKVPHKNDDPKKVKIHDFQIITHIDAYSRVVVVRVVNVNVQSRIIFIHSISNCIQLNV